MACRFTEGQLIRKVRRCPVSNDGNPIFRKKPPRWPKNLSGVWTVSKVDLRGWIYQHPAATENCWPIQLAMLDFPENGYVCACQFDPVGEETPAKVRELEEVQ